MNNHSHWRLLKHEHQDGATNMAVDEAIMIAVAAGQAPPTLRLYGWQPPCVSVGYAQRLRQEINLAACRQKGYTWVRRPTGGRAILHIDELTYSVTAPPHNRCVAGDILTSYRRLSEGLVRGLRLLGCNAAQAKRQSEMQKGSAACFDVPSHYEVTAGGRKLVGSAQVRRKNVVLQHGVLPLAGDVSRLVDVLALKPPAQARLRSKLCDRATTLTQALGRAVSFEEAAAALVEGFALALDIVLLPDELSAAEQTEAARLREKYVGDEWTFHK